MNIKTFMAIAVVALTAACSEAPETVTVDEAVQTEALNDDVTAPGVDTLTEHVEDGHLVCTPETPTAACDAQPK